MEISEFFEIVDDSGAVVGKAIMIDCGNGRTGWATLSGQKGKVFVIRPYEAAQKLTFPEPQITFANLEGEPHAHIRSSLQRATCHVSP